MQNFFTPDSIAFATFGKWGLKGGDTDQNPERGKEFSGVGDPIMELPHSGFGCLYERDHCKRNLFSANLINFLFTV